MSTDDQRGMGTDTEADVREAGKTWRRLREERGLTQRDVERLSGGKLIAQQVSRLETGALSKPAMEALIGLGRLYGLSPSDVARLYGYGGGATEEERRPAERAPVAMPKPEHERRPGAAPETYAERRHRERRRRHGREREERETWEEDLALRLLQVENLAARLPDSSRLKLNHWLDLILTLLSDELRASGSSAEC